MSIRCRAFVHSGYYKPGNMRYVCCEICPNLVCYPSELFKGKFPNICCCADPYQFGPVLYCKGFYLLKVKITVFFYMVHYGVEPLSCYAGFPAVRKMASVRKV